MKLTDLTIRSLPIPPQGQKDYWDDTLPSFGVRVSCGGSRTFILMKHRSRRALGRYPTVSLSQARKEAKRVIAEITLGSLPSTITFKETVDLFLSTHCKELRTAHEYERLLRKHFPFQKPLSKVTTNDITTILDVLPPIVANNAFGRIRTLMKWAVRRRYINRSPCDGLTLPNKAQSRDRVLTHEEIRKLWQETSTPTTFNQILRLALLLGQRRSELAAIRPEWVNGDVLTFPREVMKQNREHFVTLPSMAAEIIATTVFDNYNTWSKPKAALDARLQFTTPFVIHDLRRTLSTGLAELQTPPHLIDCILGHAAGNLHKRYNRYRYIPEIRQTLSAWQEHVLAIVAQ